MVDLTLNAKQGLFYAVDCLAATNPADAQVEYSVNAADSSQSGFAAVNNGHVAFVVRRTASDGDIKINFHPKGLEQAKDWQGVTVEKKVMDFWGCQISTGG